MNVSLTIIQQETIRKFFSVSKRQLLAGLPTGTGKTVIALKIIEQYYQENKNCKILVIVPANLRNNILSSAKKFDVSYTVTQPTSVSELEDQYHNNETNVFVVSYNFIQYNHMSLTHLKWDLVICDEFHYSKNESSTTFKAISELRKQSSGFLGLSASYVSNNIDEFLVLMSIVLNKDITKLFSKSLIYDIIMHPIINKPTRVQTGIQDIGKLKSIVKDHIYIPKEEKVQKTVRRPKVKSIIVRVPITKDEWSIQQALLKDTPKDVLVKLIKNRIGMSQLREIKNKIIALQQTLITPDYLSKSVARNVGSKVLSCINRIKKNKKKCIVFTPFFEYGAKVVHEQLQIHGIKSELYSGTTTPESRREIETKFNEGDLDVIVLTAAGKEGINLPKCEEVHFLSLTWNPEDLEQVMGRALRMTSTVPVVTVYWYFAKYPTISTQSIDDWMSKVLDRKRRLKRIIYSLLSEGGYEAVC
jgi:superfamily II DNA or RNA helicase